MQAADHARRADPPVLGIFRWRLNCIRAGESHSRAALVPFIANAPTRFELFREST